MSQEIQIAFPCPHLTVEERVFLSSDRTSLETRQPVASTGLVRILVNNEFFVPQSGLHSPAQIVSQYSGPFTILENENVIEVSTTAETVLLTLPVGDRISTDRIVQIFKNQATQIIVGNENGRLLFADAVLVGTDSRVIVKGTAASSLGFGTQSGSRGKQVYPGWVLAKREDTITNRFPKFVSPVKTNPIFKVTYSVPVQRCLRCRATSVENDYRFDPQGHILLVENENLLYQAALKILLTDRGSNPYHTWYGTNIRSQIGTKALGAVTASLSEDVRRSLAKLQDIQLEQGQYQEVTFKERLYRILSVNVFRSDLDPTVFEIDVTVQNASSQPINVSIIYTVPGVSSFLQGNDTTLQLG